MQHNNWNGFNEGAWCTSIDVRNFIQTNYKEYKGDHSFLSDLNQISQKTRLIRKHPAIMAAALTGHFPPLLKQ